MAKLYSSVFILLIFFPSLLIAQNVGVGTSNPREKLEVSGAILIGTTSGSTEGSIRYNPTLYKFEGRDNTGWKPFSIGSGESVWKKNGINIYPDTPQYSGNVGIGTIVPLTKLHVKGNGNIGIRAETANDTLPAIEAINQDSSGYAIKMVNAHAQDTVNGDIVVIEGGNAALFIGDLNILGALRNTESTLYGGSIAINDGVTVGDIAGASCTPENDTFVGINHDFGAAFEVIDHDLDDNEVFDHLIADDITNDCRMITNVYVEVYAGDDETYPLEFEMYLRGEYIFGIPEEPSANLSNFLPLPDTFPSGYYIDSSNVLNGSLCGCYTSKWGHNTNVFNGEDPNDMGVGSNNNWYVEFYSNSFYEQSYDGDYLFGYSVRVDYNWGDTIQAPAYAAYGDIRASGSIYANSDDLLGDVAEYFKVSAGRKPEVGDIVSISRKNPQTFELTSVAYDPLVAGVVSEKPSVHLNDPKSGYPIGLTGRVKVKVNLLGGKIAVGDPITSSSAEGVGMKANEDGTIIGYALEAFDGSRVKEGKIIILLARGHIEKFSPAVKVEQMDNPPYSGMAVKGSVKVLNGDNIIFVPWDNSLNGRIPSDVEFDDLFVELIPFGGDAKLIVKEVDAKGIKVEIMEKSKNFKGFYYQTDIVSSKIGTVAKASIAQASEIKMEDYTYEERLARAMELHAQLKTIYEDLKKSSGKSFSGLQGMTNGKQVSLYKKEVISSWKRNAPELFVKSESVRRELWQTINNDENIKRKLREGN